MCAKRIQDHINNTQNTLPVILPAVTSCQDDSLLDVPLAFRLSGNDGDAPVVVSGGNGCIPLLRFREASLADNWNDNEAAHLENCARCLRAHAICLRNLWHPDHFSLFAWQAGIADAQERNDVAAHLERENCRLCNARLDVMKARQEFADLLARAKTSSREDLRVELAHILYLAPLVCEPFIGRDSDVTAVCQQLEQQNILVLTGIAGVGKTVLAAAVAARWREASEARRVYTLDCARLKTQTLISLLDAIRGRLLNEPLPARVMDAESLVSGILSRLGTAPFLLLLDGLDEFASALNEPLEAALDPLLSKISMEQDQHILVTCRQADTIVAPYRLEPLHRSASLELFWHHTLLCEEAAVDGDVERLENIDETDVEGLLDRVGDLPLAVTLLAASRSRNPQNQGEFLALWNQYVADAEERPENDSMTFRTAWIAYHQLPLGADNKAQELFAMLSLLPAGMTSAMLGEMYHEAGRTAAGQLVGKNLAVFGREAYPLNSAAKPREPMAYLQPRQTLTLPGAVRGVAHILLGTRITDFLRDASGYYTSIVPTLAAQLPKRRGADTREQLLFELPNIHSLLDEAATNTCATNAASSRDQDTWIVELLVALAPLYWWVRVEGADARMAQGAAAALRLNDRRCYAAFRCRQGGILRRWARCQKDYEDARECLTEAYQVCREIQDERGAADCLKAIADVERRTGYLTRAQEKYSEAFAIYDMRGNCLEAAHCKRELGVVYRQTNQYTLAVDSFTKALSLYRDEEDEMGIANTLCGLGDCRRSQAEYAEAEACFHEAGDLYRALNYPHGLAHVERGFADLAWLRDDCLAAIRGFENAYALFEPLGDLQNMARCLLGKGEAQRSQRNHEAALMNYTRARDLYVRAESFLGLARCHLAIANHYRDLYIPDRRSLPPDSEQLHPSEQRRAEYLGMAQANFELAQEAFDQVKSPQGVADCIRGMALLYLGQGNYGEAQKRFEWAMQRYQRIETLLGVYHCQLGIAATYLKQAADFLSSDRDKANQLRGEAIRKLAAAQRWYSGVGDTRSVERAETLLREAGLYQQDVPWLPPGGQYPPQEWPDCLRRGIGKLRP